MVVGGVVRAATAASAGVVLSLAFDPFGIWLAAPLAVAIATGLFAEPSAKPWRTLRHGYLFAWPWRSASTSPSTSR